VITTIFMNEDLVYRPTSAATADELAAQLCNIRTCTRRVTDDLSMRQLMGPMLPIVNPILWEIGHVGWFHEYWTLRHAHGEAPILDRADRLWNSSTVAHATRWDLDLPDRNGVFGYMADVLGRQLDRLGGGIELPACYFYDLSIRHEDMHVEALVYTRQTLGYARPERLGDPASHRAGAWRGDVEVPGGRWRLGSTAADGFIFDNEKWAHEVDIAPFRIAKAPVTNAEFAAFVDDGGYRRREFWSAAGWAWRERVAAEKPVYWLKHDGGSWTWRRYDKVEQLPPHAPVPFVNWYEAQAWCNWAKRRLPTVGRMGSRGRRRSESGRLPLGRLQASLALGRCGAEPRTRQPRFRLRRSARGRGLRRGRQRLRMPADDRQRVGMDGLGFRAVRRLRRGPIRRLFAAVVQHAQGVARGKLRHECTHRASALPQLLHARAQRRHRRISYLRAMNGPDRPPA